MKEKEFRFQCYYRRWLYAMPLLIAAVCINPLLARLLNSFLLVCLSTAVLMALSMTIYYKLTKDRFIRTGKYRIDGGRLVITLPKKTYEFTELNEVYVTELAVYSSRMMLLKLSGNVQLKLFSPNLGDNEHLTDSSLSGLFFDVKAAFRELEPTEDDPYYLKKEEKKEN